ncbi:MAG TPA: LuxR C-terminal-related transcriptional regulator [Vicinamibacterales bacterium]|nr:LuxR C-terminal-related transcriptional regulator [Vicinamibacterales bacterium]
MRLLLVGAAADRARLREQVNGGAEIVGEFATLAAAREADVDADGILMARPSIGSGRADAGLSARGEPVEPRAVEDLTSREVQVLELLAEGLPNKAIAARLGISDQTVKFHVAAISGKLGAANRTDAVRLAVRRGLITL